ncbi:MAG: aminotransferase class I/II-fold pyridoxal phosphate-dependent enzyme [Treponema sp.]|jgi:aspartate/methionine/tyrosine aminotransferase|nr:aminotransferase class I/II-fold pyridoxal phosphate-dependent enzyme [Treponema sp.]
MNTLAAELNACLDTSVAGRLLSGLGRRIYFPKGIIAQSAEAKDAALVNATIGMAFQGGKPLVLSGVGESLASLDPDKAVVYAPTAGIEPVRQAWKREILRKNPSLDPARLSLPTVVPGITAGISYTADLFLEEGQSIIVPAPCWDNYGLIFRERRGGVPVEASGFREGARGLDLEALSRALGEQAKTGTVRIILNFPNNPSGYTPTEAEGEAIVAMIREAAGAGADVLALVDDAYFGLFYEEGLRRESLFAALAGLHERVLAVKLDGPTKEDYAWGFRSAFVSFGSRSLGKLQEEALGKKYMGLIRSSVSCANTPAQLLLLKTLADPRTHRERELHFGLLRERYRVVKRFIEDHPSHPVLRPLPFNSGYFMSFYCRGLDAEKLRRELLVKQGVGVIALEGGYIRVAYSSIDLEKIPGVFRIIYDTAAKLI